MKPSTIMIVDDNDDDIFFAKRAIAKTNPDIIVDVFNGSEEAIKHLQSGNTPALILLDLNMPGLGGTAVLRVIRTSSTARYIPVVILSQSLMEKDLKAAFDAGANSFIHKAHNMSEFEDSIKTAIHYWLDLNVSPL